LVFSVQERTQDYLNLLSVLYGCNNLPVSLRDGRKPGEFMTISEYNVAVKEREGMGG
jgi:hypothetical protein